MRKYSVLLLVAALTVLFLACGKEHSLEIDRSKLPATVLLQDSSGNCLGYFLGGTYYNGVAMADTNFVLLALNVSKTGSYIISGTGQNGFSFKDSGLFIKTGPDTIRLKASGTPLTKGITGFTLVVNSQASTCGFSVNVLDSTGHSTAGTGADTAKAVYSGASDLCTSATIQGAYKAGTPLDNTNTITIQLNVASTGAYAIATQTVNGISFSSAGKFTSPGLQTLALAGSGTPVSKGPLSIPITINGGSGTTSCSFALTVDSAAAGGGSGTAAGNTWSFTAGSTVYSGVFGNSATFEDNPLGTGKALDLFGSNPGMDSIMDIFISFSGTPTAPVPGTYTTDPNPSQLNNNFLYLIPANANANTPPVITTQNASAIGSGTKLSIVISAYDASTQIVQGTFSGEAWDKSGNVVQISNGKFSATVNF